MAKVIDQKHGNQFTAYCGDSCEVLTGLPDDSVHLSVYSPPFCGLYVYSSSERDLSNCRSYDEFFKHYEFIVSQIYRTTMPGRLSAVHCMETPADSWKKGLEDFPGDIIRLHKKLGFNYIGRHCVWKEPLAVRNRTMKHGLAHKQVVDDSSLCDMASADYLLLFRKKGDNPIPIPHPIGLLEYAGERSIPPDLFRYRGWTGDQIENRYSHWIWRQYASSFWDDIRINRVLPYREARDPEDEKHVHPLQLDVIERIVILRSNPGEIVLTPFMGVGSECAGALLNGRKAIGCELKPTYFRQAVQNLDAIEAGWRPDEKTGSLLDEISVDLENVK